MLFEKFPKLKFKGRELVWDSRQKVNAKDSWISIFSDLEATAKSELLKRLGEGGQKLAELIQKDQLPNNVQFERYNLGIAAAEATAHPSANLCVVGVTGTNGKSTSVALLRHIFLKSGKTVLEIGTLGIKIWSPKNLSQPIEVDDSGFTTPEAPQLHALFLKAKNAGVTHVVIEVSSHALSLGRVAGVNFSGAIFTNLTQDHLDFHKTMDSYEEAKRLFFSHYLKVSKGSNKVAVINATSSVGLVWKSTFSETEVKLHSFQTEDFYSKEISLKEQSFVYKKLVIKIPLVGLYNVENAIGVLELASALLAVPLKSLAHSLEDFTGVSGRLELVSPKSIEGAVFVDYAHSPDALERVLETLKKLVIPPQKLWVVFGCGGDRDPLKRPKMAEAALKWADEIVLTSDNPRSEDPEKILNEIEAPLKAAKREYHRIADRADAIRFVLGVMSPSDILLVAGKGHEQYQLVGKEKLPFSDQKIVKEFFG